MIEIKNLYKSLGKNNVIDNLTFSINNNGITAIMADSGAGKTTLINILLKIIEKDFGEIINLPNDISVVFQEDRLLENLTPIKNISICSKFIDKKEIENMLILFGVDPIKFRIKELSGGMKRRVAIARALLAKSDFIILDEPFKGLDEFNKNVVMDKIYEISRQKPILFVTHDVREINYFNIFEYNVFSNFRIYK